MGGGFQEFRWLLMLVCLVVFAVGFGGMFFSMWRRHRIGQIGQPNFHGSVATEISWALAPCVIAVLTVVPTVRVIFGN